MNAQMGGVKTREGKAVSKMNALRHGILSEAVRVVGGDAGESMAELDQLKKRVIQDLQPVGFLEAMLTDRIITLYWRLRRMYRAEVGAIQHMGCDIWFRHFTAKAQEALAARETAGPFGCYFQLIRTQRGASLIRELLADVAGILEHVGSLSDAYLRRVFAVYGREHDFPISLSIFNDVAKREIQDAPMVPNEAIVHMRELLSAEHDRLEIASNLAVTMEHHEVEAAKLTCAVPDDETAQKLIRYEAHLDRCLYRAIHELQRLQATRRGEVVPAPLAIEVNSSGGNA